MNCFYIKVLINTPPLQFHEQKRKERSVAFLCLLGHQGHSTVDVGQLAFRGSVFRSDLDLFATVKYLSTFPKKVLVWSSHP